MLSLQTLLAFFGVLCVYSELANCHKVDPRAARSFGRRHTSEDEDVIGEIDSQERSIELNRVSAIKDNPSDAITTTKPKQDQPNSDNEGHNFSGGGGGDEDEHENGAKESSQDQVFLSQHEARLKAMEDMFEKRQNRLQQSSQELNPISIGLEPPTFGPKMVQNGASLGTPNLPFAFGQLPHLLGLQGPMGGVGRPAAGAPPTSPLSSLPVDGSDADERNTGEDENGGEPPQLEPRIGPGGQKIWPKIFRFTDGRANLADFERQKKIRLSNLSHNGDDQIDPAPVIFDGRPLKRRSFLILHGGIF